MSCTKDPVQCAQHLMSTLGSHCADLVDEVMTQALPLVQTDLCHGADKEAERMLSPNGSATRLMECAAVAQPDYLSVLSYVSWPQIRQIACPSYTLARNTISDSRPHDLAPRLVMGSLMMCVLYMGIKYRNPLYKMQTWHKTTVGWWAVFFALCLALGTGQAPEVNLSGFYYRDEITACAFDLTRTFPSTILRDRVFTAATSSSSSVALYDAMRHLRVRNATLAETCGHCGLFIVSGPREAALDFYANRSSGNVTFAVLLPTSLGAAWQREFAASMPTIAAADAVWMSAAQIMADLRPAESEAALSAISGLIVCVLLFAGVFRPGRGVAGAVALVVVCIATLTLGVISAQSVARLAKVPPSPYDPMVMPIIFGTGVDAVLIMLDARDRGHIKWGVRCCPSIVASQMSTMCSFVVGLVLQVEHFFNFFSFACLSVLISCAMQISLFPVLVSRLTRKIQVVSCGSEAWHVVKWATIVVACVSSSLAAWNMRPVVLSFELLTQLQSQSISARFLNHVTQSSAGVSNAPLYSICSNLESPQLSMQAAPMLDWRSDLQASTSGFEEWKEEPMNRILYADMFRGNQSVSIHMAQYGFGSHASLDAEELARMHSLDTPGCCTTSLERVGGYTVTRVFSRMWVLMLASTVASALAGAVISGWAGLSVMFTIASSYIGILLFISASGMRMHMMSIAALVIVPGVIVDYTLHLTYSKDTAIAVLFSCATSVGSFLPYSLASSIPGVRDFASLYIGSLLIGATFAFMAAAVARKGYVSLKHVELSGA